MKVGGVPLAEDLARIEAVLKIVGSGDRLAVDVNGKFDLPQRPLNSAGDRGLRLAVVRRTAGPARLSRARGARDPVCSRRSPPANLFSMRDARNLIRHGGLRPDRDILQYDPALSYGLVEYLRTLDMLKANGWSPRRCVPPHGGHQFALNIAVGLQCGGNESYPQVFAPFGGFCRRLRRGTAALPCPIRRASASSAKADLWAVMKDV